MGGDQEQGEENMAVSKADEQRSKGRGSEAKRGENGEREEHRDRRGGMLL